MNETLNLVEILKDCPKGMELDCTMFDEVTLLEVTDKQFPIKIAIGANKYRYLTETGGYDIIPESKCVIFPKGKTTWEGFVPPCDFKDGDVIYVETNTSRWVSIFKEDTENKIVTYADFNLDTRRFCGTNDFSGILCLKRVIRETRPATEEEKQKLFQAIKDNGYKWNAETKTLEKLVKPKFDPATLKPFDQVLVRDGLTDKWHIDFFEKDDIVCQRYDTAYASYRHCIPYNDETKHLVGKTDMEPEFYQVDEYK